MFLSVNQWNELEKSWQTNEETILKKLLFEIKDEYKNEFETCSKANGNYRLLRKEGNH